MIFRFLFLVFLTYILGAFNQSFANDQKPFRLHLISEPASIHPFQQRNSNAGYLIQQIFSSPLKLEGFNIKPQLLSCASINERTINCRIQKKIKFSDGTPINADHFINTYRAFVNKDAGALRADLLSDLKNYSDIMQGKSKPETLGIKKTSAQSFQFQLAKPNPEFLYNLTSPLLSPLKEIPTSKQIDPVGFPTTGPYQITSWIQKNRIQLKPNPNFYISNPSRPMIEFLFISEDSVALGMYEEGELDFLRRVPTLCIPKFLNRPDFYKIDQFRFDYIGFSESLSSKPLLRKAVATAIDYEELRNLFFAKSRPGCAGLPIEIAGSVCIDYNKEKSKKFFDSYLKNEKSVENLTLSFSKQGGDDHQRAMELLQSHWKSNLNLVVSLEALENKIFLKNLRESPSALFRKGLAPERPTCAAVLEAFTSASDENYIKYNDKEFEKKLKKLVTIKSPKEKKNLCSSLLKRLIHNYYLIPTGPIYFSILAKENWKGWSLSQLNHLDLSNLSLTKN